jgi:predicted deacylase
MMTDSPLLQNFTLEQTEPGQIGRFWLQITTNALAQPISIPVLVVRGLEDGPVLALTAVLHGNELNGLALIHQLFREINPQTLRGTLVAIPILNTPSFLANQRNFTDGIDLNRLMPGNAHGNDSQAFSYHLVDRLNLAQFDYLIDLHTASFGRINSFYVRADMNDPTIAQMARWQNSEIILHSESKQTTFRGTAVQHNTPAITIEINDPHLWQPAKIAAAKQGIYNTLYHLNMLDGVITQPTSPATECSHSSWLYTDRGGLLAVLPQPAETIRAGQTIATLVSPFGDLIHEYTAPENGVVIGKSVNPVNQTGGRILHLGIPKT